MTAAILLLKLLGCDIGFLQQRAHTFSLSATWKATNWIAMLSLSYFWGHSAPHSRAVRRANSSSSK